jgi:hypothetical protein
VNLAVLLAAVGALAALAGPAPAGVVGVAGAVVTWLRGYLVPGTPRFAPPLVAALPGGEALFHDGPASDGGRGPPAANGDGVRAAGDGLGDAGPADDGEAVLETLLEAGAVEVSEDAVTLAPEVAAAIDEETAALSALSTADLAEAVETTADGLSARVERDGERDREWVALEDGEHALEETWLRRPVAVADVAAARALAEYVPEEDRRRAAAAALRSFRETCPDCGTDLEPGSTVPCCGGYNAGRAVPEETRVCPACEARVVTLG